MNRPTQPKKWKTKMSNLVKIIKDYKDTIKDHQRLVREIDVIMNGRGAAQQASLCDLVGQIKRSTDIIAGYKNGLKRLASPEAFIMSRIPTEEETARMVFADETLERFK